MNLFNKRQSNNPNASNNNFLDNIKLNICNLEENKIFDEIFEKNQEDDKNQKPKMLLEKQNLMKIFNESINEEKENHFCQKNINYIKGNNDQMENCKNCNRVCCQACLKICHKDCKMSRTEDLFYNHVKLFYSYCECRHITKEPENNYKSFNNLDIKTKFRIKNYKFPCYMSSELIEIFKCKDKDFKDYLKQEYHVIDKEVFTKNLSKFRYHQSKKNSDGSPYLICTFCFLNCEGRKKNFESEKNMFHGIEGLSGDKKIENPVCNCENECMSPHDDFNVLIKFIIDIFNSADEISTKEDTLKALKEVENVIRNYYDEILNQNNSNLNEPGVGSSSFNGINNNNDPGIFRLGTKNLILKEKNFAEKYVDYLVDIFKMLTVMYFDNVESLQNSLMVDLTKKIENYQDNEIYFVDNRLNMTLSFILNFYKSNLFQEVTPMENYTMNLIPRQTRINTHRANFEHLKHIKERNTDPEFQKLFDVKHIIKIFTKINEISCFSVNIDDLPKNKNYPFVGYFFLLLIKSYCFEKDDVILLKNFVLEAKKKMDKNTRYNYLVKKIVDESLYICQIFIIDDYLANKDLQNTDILHNINLKDELFFYEKKEFKKYLKIKFDKCLPNTVETNLQNIANQNLNILSNNNANSANNNYQTNNYQTNKTLTDIEKNQSNVQENSDSLGEDSIMLTREDIIIYFDIFNNEFIQRICFDNIKDINRLKPLEINKEKIEKENCLLCKKKKDVRGDQNYIGERGDYLNKNQYQYAMDEDLKNTMGYFDIFVIPYYNIKPANNITDMSIIQQQEQNSIMFLLRCIKRILTNERIKIEEITNSPNFDEVDFLEKALNCLVNKNTIFEYNLQNELIQIDFGNIDMKKYKNEMLFLFYSIFIQNLYRTSQFSLVLFQWNFLIFLFLGNADNVNFLLKDLKFLEFLLSKKYDENGRKKSYLLKSLYNPFVMQREKSFIWRYFFYIFENYIDKTQQVNFNYLKILILDNYINEIIQFYEVQHCKRKNLMKSLKISNENNLINTMNFNFICNFLKITKIILMEKNMQDFIPFTYNVNKFETIEKLSLIADIAFSENFIVDNYLNSCDEICSDQNNRTGNSNFAENNEANRSDKSKGYIINDNLNKEDDDLLENDFVAYMANNLSGNNSSSKKNFGKLRTLNSLGKKIGGKLSKYNVQYEIMDILGSTVSTPYINTYFNVINQNISQFEKFLNNKENYYKYYIQNNSEIYNLEKIIVKFLLNFLIIKIYNHKFGGFKDMEFTKGEINELVEKNKNKNFKKVLDEEDIDIDSRFLVNQMKIKIMKIFIKYFKENKDRTYSEKEKELPRMIYIYMYFILKKSFIQNLDNNKENIIYQERFLEFFKVYRENAIFERSKILIPDEEKKIAYNDRFKKRFKEFDTYKNIIDDMSSMIVADNKFIDNLMKREKEISNHSKFFCYDKFILEYFERYTEYENKRNNLFNVLIDKLVHDSKNSNKDGNVNKRKTTSHYQHSHNLHDSETFVRKIWNNFWEKINENFESNNDPDKLNILINHILIKLEEICEITKIIDSNIFDYVFNENFLEILNFLNQILYYQPQLFRKYITEQLSENQMRMLMIYTLKLSDYIIGISETETNVKLFSTSKIYFTLMDFFLFLCEGVFEGRLVKHFYETLNPIEKYDGSDIIKKINELLEEKKSILIVEKITEFLKLNDEEKIVQVVEKLLKRNKKKDIEDLNEIKKIIKEFSSEDGIDEEEEKMLYENRIRRKTEKRKNTEYKPIIGNELVEKKNTKRKYGINLFDNFSNMNRLHNENYKNERNDIDEFNDSTEIEEIIYTSNFNTDDPDENKRVSNIAKFIGNMTMEFNFIMKFNFNFKPENNQRMFKEKNKPLMIILINEYRNRIIFICDIISMLCQSIKFNKNNYEEIQPEEPILLEEFFEKLNGILDVSDKFSEIENKDDFISNFIEIIELLDGFFSDFGVILKALNKEVILFKKGEKKIEDFMGILSSLYDTLGDINETFEGIYSKEMDFFNNTLKIYEGLVNENLDKGKRKESNIEKQEEEKILLMENYNKIPEEEDNFFFQTFKQLNNILSLITNCQLENINSGSERLLVQFLYITRFIKEFTELNYKEFEDSEVKNTIKTAFTKLFSFDHIFTSYYGNNKYRMIIITSLLKILISFIEEYQDKEDKEFLKFIDILDNRCRNNFTLYIEIFKCFKRYYLNRETEGKFDEEYINNKLLIDYSSNNCFYEDDEIQLAQLYNTLLNIIPKAGPELDDIFDDTKDDGSGLKFIKIFNGNKYVENDPNNNSENNNENNDENLFDFKDKEINIGQLKKFYKFLKKISSQIEVKFTFDQNSLNPEYINRDIFFFRHPRTFSYFSSLKSKFLDNVNRESLGSKIDAFNRYYDKFLFSIDICFFYNKSRSFFNDIVQRYTNNALETYRDFNFFYFNAFNFVLVLILNILLLIYFHREVSMDTSDTIGDQLIIFPGFDNLHLLTTRNQMVVWATIPITFVQICMYLIWLYFRFHVTFWINYYGDSNSNLNYYVLDKNPENNKKNNIFKKEVNKIIDFSEHGENKERNKSRIFSLLFSCSNITFGSRWTSLMVLLRSLLFTEETFFIIWGIVLNILYVSFNWPLLIIIQILSVYNFSILYKNFMNVIKNKFIQFGTLLFLTWTVIYIFSWFAFLFLQPIMIGEYRGVSDKNNFNETDDDELMCITAWECFFNFLHLGLRMGGGIGDVLPRLSYKYDEKGLYFSKIIYENIFFIFCNLILMNVFFGVIVDSFSELREQNNTNTEDKKNKCFICHLDRFDIKSGRSFEHHRQTEHNIFEYVYVYLYLENKNNQEYSAVESYVWDQINSHRTDWFPEAEE